MANTLGLIGYNKQGASVNKLLAAFGNDVVDVATGLGYSLNLNSSNNVEFVNYLDRVFYQNYSELPLTFNGSVWSREYVGRVLLSKYIKNFKTKSRLFLGNVKFPSDGPLDTSSTAITFPSYVFHADLPVGNTLTWGIEWGRNGRTIAGTPIFELDQPIVQDFKTSNIKVGDPLFITNNSVLNPKPYFVASVASPYRLIVTENFPVSASSLHYWVSSNFFPVGTDDNDSITGFGDNSNNLIIFKLMSLWFYSGSQLRQLQDFPGTSSQRSVVNSKGYTYYFHGSHPDISGIYRFDGSSSVLSSRAIDPFIHGMSTSNYPSVIAWKEGNNLRFFLGDVSNSNYNILMTNAIATLNTVTNAWSVDPIADVITAVAPYRTSNQEDYYTGTSDSQVLKMNSGNSHNGTPIRMRLETKAYYPLSTETINLFTRLQVISRNARGLRVGYKLWNTPKNVDDNFYSLGEIDADKTELVIPKRHQDASGFSLEFDDYNILENDAYVEKATMFYLPEMTRVNKDAK